MWFLAGLWVAEHTPPLPALERVCQRRQGTLEKQHRVGHNDPEPWFRRNHSLAPLPCMLSQCSLILF